jgi:endoglucanase
MKKLYFLTTMFIINIVSGQVVYQDNFSTTATNTSTSPGMVPSIVSNALRITGNGTNGQFANIEYTLNSAGLATTADISANKKMYIKAKSSVAMNFRADLRDSAGFNSNLNPVTLSLTNSYQVFEIDFSGTNRLKDGAYGGPCLVSGCNVNPNAIKNIVFYLNPGTGNYNGTVDIDWISFGQSLEVITTPIYLRANLVGYFKNGPKAVTLLSKNPFAAQNYEVFNGTTLVTSGTTSASEAWSDAGQHVAKIDLSSITTNGTYTVKIPSSEVNIKILDNPIEDLSVGALKYYYYNRASTAITTANGGAWARATGTLDTDVRIHSSAATTNRPTNTVISSPKGWYDAGDLNKYIVNSGISTYTLLAAFENYKTHFENKNLNLPESGNTIPDILDEVVWNLDWMLTMQNKVANGGDGSVYHKLSGLNFEGRIMPQDYALQRYAIGRSTSAALNFAAVMATASRIFSNYEAQKPGYSATMLAAAREAYTWAKANPTMNYTGNPAGVATGAYEDNNVTDEFQWAAVELFITTGETTYKNDISYTNLTNGWVPGWQSTSTLGVLSIANNLNNVNVLQLGATNTTTVLNKLKSIANTMKTNVTTNPVETAMKNTDFNWGSNGGAANQIVILLSAYKATNDATYLTSAYKALDYLLGRNAIGISFVTGYGDASPLKPHHRISDADGIALPVPGMLVGGPQNAAIIASEGCTYTDTTKAGRYIDDWCSYSTNEVTINWNAPLAYAVNALSYYNTTVLLSNENFDNETFNKNVLVYPNPAKNEITISSNIIGTEKSYVEVYDLQGRLVLGNSIKNQETKLNIESLTNGVYIVKITADNLSTTKKFIKE